jgi:two-component system OmpR family response regulator
LDACIWQAFAACARSGQSGGLARCKRFCASGLSAGCKAVSVTKASSARLKLREQDGPATRRGRARIAKALVIEDDPQTALYVTEGLQELGHIVSWAATGPDGLFQASHDEYGLIIVDRMLPGLDGLTLVRQLRSIPVHTPVLFLTTMDGLDARVEGLEGGGDDYLTKPFAMAELVARANALIRRSQRFADAAPTRLRVGSLEMDLLAREVTRAGQKIELQQQEFRLLEYLMQNSGRTVTRSMLLEKVWGLDFDPGTTVLESHISRLRAKVDRGFDGEIIHTVRGSGYVLRAN